MGVWNVIFASQMDVKSRIDSDYFLPEYVVNESKLDEIETKKLTEVFSVSDGNHLEVSRHFSDDNEMIPYYRGKDINDFFIENANPIRIPSHIYNMGIMKRSHFKAGDVLLSIVGTIGSLSVVPDTLGDSTGSCKIAILRKKGAYSPFLLAAFLLSKYGQSQIKRNTRGAVQMGLILKDFVNIRVPILNSEAIEEIESLVTESIRKNTLSKSLYSQAQDILEKELGLDKLVKRKFVGYETNFSEVLKNGRSDPEFFHAKFDPLINKIKEYSGGAKPLYQISKAINVNFNPSKSKGNFHYIEIGDINISDGSYRSMSIPAKNLPANAKIKLNGGELLISQVRPTRGAISIIDDELHEDTVCSGAFYTCKIIDGEQREAIFLYLRMIKEVFEKYCGGTSYPTIDSRYLKAFLVPTFETEFSKEIKALITESKRAKKESEMLLENGKKRIEDLIEGVI
jgi:restriction endonuclease S subunit